MTTAASPNSRPERIRIIDLPSEGCIKRFNSGVPQVDDWARNKAHKFHIKNRSKAYCAVRTDGVVALGFYALSLSASTSKKLFGQDADFYKGQGAPLIYVDWLGVQRSVQRQGIGTMLLMNAISKAYQVSKYVCIYGVGIRPVNQETKRKYEAHGFHAMEDGDHPLMILPVWSIKELFEGSPADRSGATPVA